jgi:hypothetical protein
VEAKVKRPSELFDAATIERKFDAKEIDARRVEGWGWKELASVDPAAGGAPRAQVDALRLMAVFLSHWDNKPENQRLVCLDRPKPARGQACSKPLAMVQDLGGTFGPFKLDLRGWASAPVWADASCRLSMQALPYGGSSFSDVAISETGRAFLAERLRRLSDSQIRQLFEGARFARAARGEDNPTATIDDWVDAFKAKRAVIVNRRCPPVA